jgi:FtsH-binding integral membrane protein
MDQQSSPLQRLGRYSGIAVVLSVVACYGTLALVAVLSLAGVTISIHEGAWAAVIVVFAWTAVLAMGVNIQRHRSFAPFVLSNIGALLVSWVMIVDYSRVLEVTGFALLIVAALWDHQLRRRGPAPLPNSDKGS